MKKVLGFLVFCNVMMLADDYELGYGVKLTDTIHLSGYISTEYVTLNKHNSFVLDDVALLLYGHISPKLSYFSEVESSSIYVKDFQENMESTNTTPHIELLYVDYAYSEHYHVRVGKQVSPLGYWNFEPINVLRDTTSSPSYSFTMFPKLFTGVDLYGKLAYNERLHYHLFMQNSKGISDKELNIKSNFFVGVSLNYSLNAQSELGGSLGRYEPEERQNTTVDYLQFNAKYNTDAYEFQTEFIYTKTADNQSKSNNELVGYMQGQYNLTEQHALIARYEYIDREQLTQLGILGYSYRPITPLSFKVEYQFHEKREDNNLLMSLSVLF